MSTLMEPPCCYHSGSKQGCLTPLYVCTYLFRIIKIENDSFSNAISEMGVTRLYLDFQGCQMIKLFYANDI